MHRYTSRTIGMLLTLLTFATFPIGNALAAVNEADVLRQIHAINLTEIKVGDLAQNKGFTQNTKRFGEELVTDHSKADEQVRELARKESIDLNVETPFVKEQKRKETELMAMLQRLQGNDFDRSLAQHMDTAHANAIASLESSEKTLQHTQTASLIRELIPTMKKHEKAAERIQFAE